MRELCDITGDDLDRYRAHVLDLARSPGRRAHLLHAVRVLWAYRDHLPASCRVAGSRPFGAASSLELADAVVKTRHNRTLRIPPETMEALLGWALRMVEDFAPDIHDALSEYRHLMNGTHPVTRSFAPGRGTPVADRAGAYVRQLAASGGSLPGKTGREGNVVLDVPHLARLLGVHKDKVRRVSPGILDIAGDLGLPLASDAPLGGITALLHGVPWRIQPIGLRELPQMVMHLATACFVVIAYLSGMRPGENGAELHLMWHSAGSKYTRISR
ncbi:hypothetical protein ABZZ79_37195 [Streptomyces sp. NPDC006458]|uniref:hypothetical protein n=1 Tax=Streptomyces sp. NPDC006458 TaxID=3154302 RepID=UPI0033B0153C